MDIHDIIVSCQTSLYGGFVKSTNSNLDWLNVVCGEFRKLFNNLHKFLIFDCRSNTNIIEVCFLCIAQICCCIKFMEKTINAEDTENSSLGITRQYFLDRILWCLAKIKSVVSSAEDNVQTITSISENNFVTYMDHILNILTPFTEFSINSNINNAERRAEAMIDSVKIRNTIEALVGQTLAFANVAVGNDKNSLTIFCQNVLRESIALENECSLSTPHKNLNENICRLKALELENSLYQLENLVNDCLVRLVYSIFSDLNDYPITKLRLLLGKDGNTIDEYTEQFDLLLDRLMQVGIFAVAFTDDCKTKSILRSCLASIESLDTFIVPSIFSSSKTHSKLLEEHWLEETHILKMYIQEIIDTNAFCISLIDELSNCIDKSKIELNNTLITDILKKTNVFKEHLIINNKNLPKNNYIEVNKLMDDLELIYQECNAAIKLSKDVESSRVIKRFKILYSILKKLQDRIQPKKHESPTPETTTSNIFNTKRIETDPLKNANEKITEYDSNNSKKYFQDLGIKPPTCSILYRTTVEIDNNTAELRNKNNTSIIPTNNSKRVSLRVAMFKKQKHLETLKFCESLRGGNNTLSLHITDILDQLTGLSDTFNDEKKCFDKMENNAQTLDNDFKIKIHITEN